jgi:site-specific DNA-methyltransferase (adenine-specific)
MSRFEEIALTVRVIHGDCREVLKTLGADSVDSVVCDPPYHLTSIVKRFGNTSLADDTQTSERTRAGADAYTRGARGFMGKVWDGGDVAFRPETWAEVLRVLKPGGHLLAFGGTRTYHRLVCAIEDAGFEVRDTISWLFGSGFPKNHDISKAIDKAAGVEREVVGRKADPRYARAASDTTGSPMGHINPRDGAAQSYHDAGNVTAPATPGAQKWSGFGSALKPAMELIVLARKPLSEKTLAANVLKHGTGALNIDACRIKTDRDDPLKWESPRGGIWKTDTQAQAQAQSLGRFPANVTHDSSEEVLAGFPDGGAHPNGKLRRDYVYDLKSQVPSDYRLPFGFNDSGSAARFFYSAKADADDRLKSKHPTIKPVDLMRWLVRLVTPPGGTILDPFAGSGTTGMAAMAEGFDAVLIEREAEYVADIERRIAHVDGADTPLFADTPSDPDLARQADLWMEPEE